MHFSRSLSGKIKKSFLVALNAVCLCIRKIRNRLIFKDGSVPTVRNMICLILSLLQYWSRCKGRSVELSLRNWLSDDLNMISIQVLAPIPLLTWCSIWLHFLFYDKLNCTCWLPMFACTCLLVAILWMLVLCLCRVGKAM
jgi:hypothetical protein